LAAYVRHFPLAPEELAFLFDAYRYLMFYFVLLCGTQYYAAPTVARLVRAILARHLGELDRHSPEAEFPDLLRPRRRARPGDAEQIIGTMATRLKSLDRRWEHIPRGALREDARQQIFALYRQVYRPRKFASPDHGRADDRSRPGFVEFWDYYDEAFVIRRPAGAIGAFFLAKRTPHGLKLNLGGTDGTARNKAAFFQVLRRTDVRGVYCELSAELAKRVIGGGRLRSARSGALRAGTNPAARLVVNPRLVGAIKRVEGIGLEADGVHYTCPTEFADGESRRCRRIMIGRPLVDRELRRPFAGKFHCPLSPEFRAEYR